MRKLILFISIIALNFHFTQAKAKVNYKDWAVKISDSEIKHNPELWMADFVTKPKWDYTQGLIAKALMQTYSVTGDSKYYNYVHSFADFFINKEGGILTYSVKDYNIDRLNGGVFLFDMYEKTKDEKYLKAINLLRAQLLTHPRVSEGGFWHKKIYPNQVWLDGLYMGSPFYCQYGYQFKDSKIFDDVFTQFYVADKFTYDPKTGLNFHGWDESKTQKWSNPITGQSPNFWSRSMGWYMMAMVDVLDYFPKDHPKRNELIAMLNKLSASLVKYQDSKTGMWYQVTNLPKREGNYLESSGTAMFVYAMAKGAHKGYISKKYLKVAQKGFKGIVKYSTQKNEDGTTSITNACSVAGLGGTPYRDGSYEYYIGEPIRNDDPKVIGPFIMAALELAK